MFSFSSPRILLLWSLKGSGFAAEASNRGHSLSELEVGFFSAQRRALVRRSSGANLFPEFRFN